jgi:outer membrane protein assembly factor BamB
MLWTVAHRFCFWDGSSFQTPKEFNVPPEVQLRSSSVPLTIYLIGDSTRGLFGVQYEYYHRSVKDIFRLSDGAATYLTTTPAEGVGDKDKLYIMTDGRFLHWGDERFVMYDDGIWRNVANNPGPEAAVIEVDGDLFVYNHQTIYRLTNDAFTETPIIQDPDSLGEFIGLWEDDTLIFLLKKYGPCPDCRRGEQKLVGSEIHAYGLTSGQRIDLDWDGNLPGDWIISNMMRTADGSFWLLLSGSASSTRLARLCPGGNIQMLPDVCGFPWQALFSSFSRNVLKASDGTIWFASGDLGVFQYEEGVLYHHDYRQNPSCPVYCESIDEGPDGAIYVNSGYWLYAFQNTNMPAQNAWAHIPNVRRLDPYRSWRKDIDRGMAIGRVMGIGKTVIAHSTDLIHSRFVSIDSAKGDVRFDMDFGRAGNAWAVPYSEPGLVLLLAGENFIRLDPMTGATATLLTYDRDKRIEPIIVGQDFLVGRGYRSESVFRVSSMGRELWSTPLPGYILTHMTANKDAVLVQTRQGSYGGQATSAIDIASGSLLWSDCVNAYGCGTDIDAASEFMVEADAWLSPAMTEGWIIARKPRTGERLWHYKRSIHVINHKPILDPATNNVFAIFEDGAVVCLRGDNGGIVWETRLLERPFPAPAASYEPYQSCMTTFGDILSVVDRNHEIYLLDKNTGAVRARFDVTSAACVDGIYMRSDELICPPAFTDNEMVILTSRKMEAYNLMGIVSDNVASEASGIRANRGE